MIKLNHFSRKGFCVLIISLLPLLTSMAKANDINEVPPANNLSQNTPAISIIIDDMGYRLKLGQRAVNLHGALTYSFLPHSPHSTSLLRLAQDQNKEIMLHLPMESEAGKKLGPGGLTQYMTEEDFIATLESNIASIPHAKGFNNHMGSLLTKSKAWMTRLMREVATDKNLFFVDSKTTSHSVALHVARAEGLKSIHRDIFIDHEETDVFIQKQLRKLIRKAKRNGTALAIAHPKHITLSVLEKWLPELDKKGIKLVPVSALIELRQKRKLASWKN